MVLRRGARQFGILAVACMAAASADRAAVAQAFQDGMSQPAGGSLVWGGRLPQPGDGYVPSVPDPAERTRRSAPAAAYAPQPMRRTVLPDAAAGTASASSWSQPASMAPARSRQAVGSAPRAPEPPAFAVVSGWSLEDDILGRRRPRQGTGAPIEAAPAAGGVFDPNSGAGSASPGYADLSASDGSNGPDSGEAADPAEAGDGLAPSLAAAPAPLVASYVFGTTTVAVGESLPEDAEDDPWAGLKEVSPGAGSHDLAEDDTPEDRGSRVASLEPMAGPARGTDLSGRGALEDETPGGYVALPRAEAQCRAALHRLGVRFAEAAPVQRGRSCGIAHPVKVLALAGDVKVSPAAVLNCPAAARLSQWVESAVKPAALSTLGTRPATLLASSSYRCSRVAGTNRISQHASGSALDLRGFVFADGRRFVVEKKGMFSFGEKRFQRAIRTAGCRYFGTVLGPGYNWDHRNHLHLDIRPRRRAVCR